MPLGEAGDNSLAPAALALRVVTSLAGFRTESQENKGPSHHLRPPKVTRIASIAERQSHASFLALILPEFLLNQFSPQLRFD